MVEQSNTQDAFPSISATAPAPRAPRPRRRNIQEILARRTQRLRERRETLAPDFLHGEASLEEVYEALGEQWVEQAMFVETIRDAAGDVVAISVATFNDYFLTIEQAVRGEADDLEAWLEERASERRSCVELVIDEQADDEAMGALAVGGSVGVIPIYCSLARLIQLEREFLSVTRDGELGDRAMFDRDREAVLQDSRTNLLSLVTLAARLLPA